VLRATLSEGIQIQKHYRISGIPEKIAEKGQSEVGAQQSDSAFLTTLISGVRFVKNNLKTLLRI